MDWRDPAQFFPDRKLRVGVLYNDGVVRPHPPILRAITELAEKLKGSPNIDVVEWKPWKHDLSWSIIVRSSSPFTLSFWLLIHIANKSAGEHILLRRWRRRESRD